MEPAAANAEAGSNDPSGLTWAVPLFVVSGCAALIYEVVWLQLLQLVIGLTTLSLGVLLGIYMGGMCIGSLCLARFVSIHRNPLCVYAALELGIGVTGLGVLFLLPWASDLYTRFGGAGSAGILVRALVAAVCLLPPTILMGATLPAISRWVETTPRGAAWLGWFYGGNLVGAVFGCLLAGFYLLRVHDATTATAVAVGLNLVAAIGAFGLARWAQPHTSPLPSARTATTPPPRTGLVCIVLALSGVSALGAEVVWTRLLSLLLGGTVYTFSIILAVFLLGLGFGSAVGSQLARTLRHPLRALGSCQILLTIGIAWTALATTRSLPYWPVNPSLSLSPWYSFQLDMARVLWATLPAACLWGASFPLGLAAVTHASFDPGRIVGRLYAANTLGAISGALLFSLVLLPACGTQWSQRILVLVAGAASLIAFAAAGREQREVSGHAPGPRWNVPRLACALCCGLALCLMLAASIGPTPWGLIAYGRYLATYAARLAPGVVPETQIPSGGSPDIFATYVGEGRNGAVAVTKWTSGVRNFHSAGKIQASSDPLDMRLQRMLGHLSALAVRKPESVLVVACGAGVTAGAFVVHPGVERIVICDIEPLVPARVAPLFAKENHHVMEDPRTQVVADDGRHFIRTTREKFDVITSDPIDPWVKGCAALNTVEYYEMCKQHLKPGGVMSLWLPLYESTPEAVKSSIATFLQVFPDGMLFSNDDAGEGYDAVLLGQAGPTRIDLDELQERFDSPDHARVKESLREVGFHTIYGLLGTYAGRAGDLRDFLADAQINTDRNLRLQYLAGLAANSYRGGEILDAIVRNRRYPDSLFVGSPGRRQAMRFALFGADAAGDSAPPPADRRDNPAAGNPSPGLRRE